MLDPLEAHQAEFEQRWGQLTLPHVRALAWLLDAPDLLDARASLWQGKIATLSAPRPALLGWLRALERDPAPLDDAMGTRIHTRLGLYAEKLMAFYFQQHGQLVAHGLQVRATRNDTVGEFDFLLDAGAALDHLELATKFYLQDGDPHSLGLDGLVGPNLADTLGKKMRKIVQRQLTLGSHPAALAILPRPVRQAQALIKGWLFYRLGQAPGPALGGIAPTHCRGFWCAQDEVADLDDGEFVLLPRLAWLAPYKSTRLNDALTRAQLQGALATHFALANTPMLVACVRRDGPALIETRRGFVVPNDWCARSAAKRAA